MADENFEELHQSILALCDDPEDEEDKKDDNMSLMLSPIKSSEAQTEDLIDELDTLLGEPDGGLDEPDGDLPKLKEPQTPSISCKFPSNYFHVEGAGRSASTPCHQMPSRVGRVTSTPLLKLNKQWTSINQRKLISDVIVEEDEDEDNNVVRNNSVTLLGETFDEILNELSCLVEQDELTKTQCAATAPQPINAKNQISKIDLDSILAEPVAPPPVVSDTECTGGRFTNVTLNVTKCESVQELDDLHEDEDDILGLDDLLMDDTLDDDDSFDETLLEDCATILVQPDKQSSVPSSTLLGRPSLFGTCSNATLTRSPSKSLSSFHHDLFGSSSNATLTRSPSKSLLSYHQELTVKDKTGSEKTDKEDKSPWKAGDTLNFSIDKVPDNVNKLLELSSDHVITAHVLGEEDDLFIPDNRVDNNDDLNSSIMTKSSADFGSDFQQMVREGFTVVDEVHTTEESVQDDEVHTTEESVQDDEVHTTEESVQDNRDCISQISDVKIQETDSQLSESNLVVVDELHASLVVVDELHSSLVVIDELHTTLNTSINTSMSEDEQMNKTVLKRKGSAVETATSVKVAKLDDITLERNTQNKGISHDDSLPPEGETDATKSENIHKFVKMAADEIERHKIELQHSKDTLKTEPDITKTDIKIKLEPQEVKLEPATAIVTPILSSDIKQETKKPQQTVMYTDYYAERNCIEEQNELTRLVMQKWSTEGIQCPETNLTFSTYLRQKGNNQGSRLEGSKISTMYVERDGYINDLKVQDGYSVNNYMNNLQHQLRDITEGMQCQSLIIMNDAHKEDARLHEIHRNRCHVLRCSQQRELAHKHRLRQENPQMDFIIQNQLMQLECEYHNFRSRIDKEHAARVHVMRVSLKESLANLKAEYMKKCETHNSVIDQLKNQIESKVDNKYGPHIVTDLVKGPCKSNNQKRSYITVCLPADIASAILREDDVYDTFYKY